MAVYQSKYFQIRSTAVKGMKEGLLGIKQPCKDGT